MRVRLHAQLTPQELAEINAKMDSVIDALSNPNHDYYNTPGGGTVNVFCGALSRKFSVAFVGIKALFDCKSEKISLYANTDGYKNITDFYL